MDYTKIPKELIYREKDNFGEFGVKVENSVNSKRWQGTGT